MLVDLVCHRGRLLTILWAGVLIARIVLKEQIQQEQTHPKEITGECVNVNHSIREDGGERNHRNDVVDQLGDVQVEHGLQPDRHLFDQMCSFLLVLGQLLSLEFINLTHNNLEKGEHTEDTMKTATAVHKARITRIAKRMPRTRGRRMLTNSMWYHGRFARTKGVYRNDPQRLEIPPQNGCGT